MRRSLVAALLAVVLLAVPAHGQNRVPYGAVVQDQNGDLWVVLDAQRYRLPIYPLESDRVEAIPASDQWMVPSSKYGWDLGPQPEWASGPPPFASPLPAEQP